jgi:hypothetical protein
LRVSATLSVRSSTPSWVLVSTSDIVPTGSVRGAWASRAELGPAMLFGRSPDVAAHGTPIVLQAAQRDRRSRDLPGDHQTRGPKAHEKSRRKRTAYAVRRRRVHPSGDSYRAGVCLGFHGTDIAWLQASGYPSSAELYPIVSERYLQKVNPGPPRPFLLLTPGAADLDRARARRGLYPKRRGRRRAPSLQAASAARSERTFIDLRSAVPACSARPTTALACIATITCC